MKISIVGGGNAGCITALHYAFYTQDIDNLEIELIYNPDIPPEPVGQGTLLDVPKLLWLALRETWYHNSIHATFKSGIFMRVGVRRMIRFFMNLVLRLWPCIIVLGKCRKGF